jgi:protein-disulfide isomerase
VVVGFAAGWALRPGAASDTGTEAQAASQSEPQGAAEGGAGGQQEQPGMLAERTKGDPGAPVTIFEISDFQCPYCALFAQQTLPTLEREYIETGKVKLVFLNLPLVQIHPNAAAAHEFAMCAARQDRFWPAHDLLFRHQEQWAGLAEPGPYFVQLGDSADLEADDLVDCFDTGAMQGLIQYEARLNAQSGIRSTPSFVVEGLLIPGALPLENWRPVLDSIYTDKTRE